jgi:hypothetical protein
MKRLSHETPSMEKFLTVVLGMASALPAGITKVILSV